MPDSTCYKSKDRKYNGEMCSCVLCGSMLECPVKNNKNTCERCNGPIKTCEYFNYSILKEYEREMKKILGENL